LATFSELKGGKGREGKEGGKKRDFLHRILKKGGKESGKKGGGGHSAPLPLLSSLQKREGRKKKEKNPRKRKRRRLGFYYPGTKGRKNAKKKEGEKKGNHPHTLIFAATWTGKKKGLKEKGKGDRS